MQASYCADSCCLSRQTPPSRRPALSPAQLSAPKPLRRTVTTRCREPEQEGREQQRGRARQPSRLCHLDATRCHSSARTRGKKKEREKKRARTELHVGSNKTKQHSLKLKAAEVQLSLLASSTGLQSLQRATVPACLVVHTHVNFRTSTRGAEKATRRYNIRIGAIKSRQHAEPCDRDFKLHSSFFNSESACRRRHGTRLPPQRRFNKTRQHTKPP